MPPNDPDWVNLIEQQDELAARLKHRVFDLSPTEPDESDKFSFGYDFVSEHEEPFRRGFPHFISDLSEPADWNATETARVFKDLTHLVRTTTVRGFSCEVPFNRLSQLLAVPAVAELTGLSLMYPRVDSGWRAESPRYFRLVAKCDALRSVKQLWLYSQNPVGAAELAGATAFNSVRRLTLLSVGGTKSEIEKLTGSAWFRRLWHFRGSLDKPDVAVQMITGLGNLPELHTLDLQTLHPKAVSAFAAGEFPALAKLIYYGPLDKKFATAKFPSLVVLQARGGAKNEGLAELLKAPWFGQLRVLDLSDNGIGDKGVQALAAHPVAKQLRVLKLGNNPIGKAGLAALADADAFPALTALDLYSYRSRKAKGPDLVAFLKAFRLPRLRRLNLSNLPLGAAGAKALAANPAFAGLTHLDLDGCSLGNAGATALIASPHLQNLLELRLDGNGIRTGADALTSQKVMPQLGVCSLGYDVPEKSKKELRRRPRLYLT